MPQPPTVNKKIRDALSPFGYPVSWGEHIGSEPQYYSFNYSTFGIDFADDAPNHERYLVQVHFYCPRTFDPEQLSEDTKHALFAAGFTWAEMTDASVEDGRHLVFECEIAEGVRETGEVRS